MYLSALAVYIWIVICAFLPVNNILATFFIIPGGHWSFILQELGPKSYRTICQRLCPAHPHNVHQLSSLL